VLAAYFIARIDAPRNVYGGESLFDDSSYHLLCDDIESYFFAAHFRTPLGLKNKTQKVLTFPVRILRALKYKNCEKVAHPHAPLHN
jgi:hypothetical protein